MQLGLAERGFKQRSDCPVQTVHSLLSRKARSRPGRAPWPGPVSSCMAWEATLVPYGLSGDTAAAGNSPGAGALKLATAEPLGPPGLLVAGPSQRELEKGRGQPWHCQHDSAPPRPAGQGVPHFSLLWPPTGQVTSYLASSRKSQGPHSGAYLQLCPIGGQKLLEVSSLMWLRQRPIGNSTSPERDSREADWLPSHPDIHFQGIWTSPLEPTGSGQEGILGSGERPWSPTEVRAHPKALSYHHKGKGP